MRSIERLSVFPGELPAGSVRRGVVGAAPNRRRVGLALGTGWRRAASFAAFVLCAASAAHADEHALHVLPLPQHVATQLAPGRRIFRMLYGCRRISIPAF